MSILYPISIDDATTLPPPGPNTVTNAGSVTHAVLHDNEILALQALETKLGIGSSTPTTSTVLRASSNGTSTWGKVVLTSDVTGILPVANGGMVPLGTGVATFLATPSSANLAAAVTDETGSGSLVFGTSPNITTPTGIVKGDVGLGNVDNTSDSTKNAASVALTNHTITDATNTIGGAALNGLYRFNTQAITTNTTQVAAIIKEGWNYVTANGVASTSVVITFPTAFPTSVQQVQYGLIGAKTSAGAPTTLTDFNVATSETSLIISQTSLSTSGVTINMFKSPNFSTGVYYGVWWRVVGT